MRETIRYAFRSLRRSPGFASLIFFIITISIAACCCVFSVLYVQVLKPIVFEDPEQLVWIYPDPPATIYDYKEWIQPSQSMESFSACKISGFQTRIGDERMRFPGLYVTSDFFSVLKLKPIRGPGMSPAHDQPGAAPVAMIGYGLWKGSFHADENVIGKQIVLNTIPHTIIGVMPRDFSFWGGNYLWVPMSTAKSGPGLGQKVFILGRMKRGITQQQAAAEFTSRAKAIHGKTAHPVTFEHYSRETDTEYEKLLTLLFCATLLVLLIACLNVGNLILMRTASRQKEIAIQLALGASMSSIIKQTFIEMLFLFLPAGFAGLWLGIQSLKGLTTFFGYYLSGSRPVTFNLDLWLFSLILSSLTAGICSVFPVVRLRKAILIESLKEGGQRSASDHRGSRLRPFAVILQIALGMLLLTGAGLVLRSIIKIYQVQPQFDTSNIITGHITLPLEKYPDEQAWRRTYQQILQNLKAQPGIVSAAATTNLPLRGTTRFEKIKADPGLLAKRCHYRDVTPDYFHTLKIRLLAGRYFNEHDTAENQPVVIVNESFAKLIGNQKALGKYISLGEDEVRHQIVGIVADIRHSGLNQPFQPEVSACLLQHPFRWVSIFARTTGPPEKFNSAFMNSIWAVDPDQPIIAVQTMEDVIESSVEDFYFIFVLLSIFGGLALLLLLFGVYSVLAYSVSERNHEIGIRIALGAGSQSIFKMIYREGTRLLAAGIIVGIALGMGTLHVLKSYLFGVDPIDPVTFVFVISGILIVGFGAVFFPALRAIRTDPLAVLRNS
ncbi:ABC transporter permease [bacterium]|nr:ABC transporter permease [bacterium]